MGRSRSGSDPVDSGVEAVTARSRSGSAPEPRRRAPLPPRNCFGNAPPMRNDNFTGNSSRSSMNSSRTLIKLCRPRRHVAVKDTPGAFLATDLNEYRIAQRAERQRQVPQFQQRVCLNNVKGGKPMNFRFENNPRYRSCSDPPHHVAPRFRNLNQDDLKLNNNWNNMHTRSNYSTKRSCSGSDNSNENSSSSRFACLQGWVIGSTYHHFS